MGKIATHSSIWTFPHLLQLELFNTSLVWCDSRAFNANIMLEDGIRSIDRDLIIGLGIKEVNEKGKF